MSKTLLCLHQSDFRCYSALYSLISEVNVAASSVEYAVSIYNSLTYFLHSVIIIIIIVVVL